MENNYVSTFIQKFLSKTIPPETNYVVITPENKHALRTGKQVYDFIIVVGVLEWEQDIFAFMEQATIRLAPRGRLIIIFRNYLQTFLRSLLQSIVIPLKPQNWLSATDIKSFLYLTGYEPIYQEPLCLFPYHIPLFSFIANHVLLNLFPLNHLSPLHYIVARRTVSLPTDASVSIIIPARNEAGTIQNLVQNLPVLGTALEVIFVEGHSKDETRSEINRVIMKQSPKSPFKMKLIDQGNGIGKADAVWKGFTHASGDILMIYDADMSVAPQDLRKFYLSLISGKGDFINGSRLVYPLEGNAMQFINILGNKFFSLLFSWLLSQSIKDTLCGTKVLWKRDFMSIRRFTSFGRYDPFGDFDLLLGARLLQLKITDLPLRYRERQYGTTNIKRFRNALQLLHFSIRAFTQLKLRV